MGILMESFDTSLLREMLDMATILVIGDLPLSKESGEMYILTECW